jgi:hypothetical protein
MLNELIILEGSHRSAVHYHQLNYCLPHASKYFLIRIQSWNMPWVIPGERGNHYYPRGKEIYQPIPRLR